MAVTYATLQGRITPPGTDIGVRGRLVGTPLSTGQALIITGDSRITLGPVEARTDGSGALPASGPSAFRVPLGTIPAPADLLWQLIFYPEDKHLKPWTVAVCHITVSGDIKDLAQVDLLAVDPVLATTVAENAAAAAVSQEAAAASASEASGWAAAALSSAADADADAAAAATSEANASSSASSASTSAGTATTKAGQAASSQSAAATSETNAATSATAAQTARTGAENARDVATAAAASVPGIWQPNTVYTAGSVKTAPDGSTLSRNADGTSRATFDATEQAAWTAVLAKAGTIEEAALHASLVPRSELPGVALSNHADARRPLGSYVRAGVVIGPGAPGAWDAAMVESACPVWDPQTQRYCLIYTGYAGTKDAPTDPKLGLAWSDKPEGPYVKDAANPILVGSATVGQPDRYGVTGAMAFYKPGSDTWTLYSIGTSAPGYEGGATTLCRYVSPTLKNPVWTPATAAVAPSGTSWRERNAWIGSIVKRADTYHMFLNGTAADYKERIGHATSSSIDGPWTVDTNPVLDVGNEALSEWDCKYVGQPWVFRIGDIWYMEYYGFNHLSGVACDGLAWTTDAEFPIGWRKHASNPIVVGQAGSYDAQYAHKPFSLVFPDRIFHFYTAVKADLTRQVALVVFGGKRDTLMYPIPDQDAARSTTSTTFTALAKSSLIFDPTGRRGLRARLHVRGNPGGGTMTVRAQADSTMPSGLQVVLTGGAWVNGSSGWYDLGQTSLFDAYMEWKVTAGTGLLGTATWELEWYAP